MASHDGSSPLALKNITGICSILTSAGFRASDWEGLASQLRINDPGRIKVMHPQHPALCLEETIRQWLNEDTETSWEKLGTAVSQVEGYGEGTKQKILPRAINGALPKMDDSSVRVKVNEFELQFERLTSDARSEIEEKQTSPKTFRHSLTCLPIHVRTDHQQYIEENLDKIHEAGNIEKIFLYLNLYWSFLDYSLLEYIIQRYGSIDLKRRMSQYVENVASFRQTTTVGQLIRIWPGRVEPPPNFSQVTSKLNKNASEYTLEELEKLRKRFCSQFRLSDCVLVLAGGSNNSVVIYWRIPSSLALELTAAVSLTESSFFEQLGVLKLEVDGFCAFEQNYTIESSSARQDPQQTELDTDLMSQIQRLQLENEELLARPQEQKTHPPPGQKLHQPPLKDPQVNSNSCLTKGDDTTVERKLDHGEESGAQQPQEVEHEKDSTTTVQLQGRLSATEALLKLERKRKEELQQQMVESEWQAKQAKVKLEEAELVNKQLLTEKDQLTAVIEQREAQMEWERKDKETTVRSLREREEVAVQRGLELQKQMDVLTKQYAEKLAAKDGQLREHFESYQQLQSELQSKEQLIEQLQADYESLKSQYTELQTSYREVENKYEHMKLHEPPLKDPQVGSNSCLTKGDDTSMERKVDHGEESSAQQPQELEHMTTTVSEKTQSTQAEKDSTATVQLRGRLSATEALLKVERNRKEELQQQMAKSEWQAKQAKVKLEEAELFNKQLLTEKDQLTAVIEQREAQMEWERKDRETAAKSFREKEEVAVRRGLELQDELAKQRKIHTEQHAAKDKELMQLREQFESYQRLQSELQSKQQLIEQLQADYVSLKSQYTELQAGYQEVEDKNEHMKMRLAHPEVVRKVQQQEQQQLLGEMAATAAQGQGQKQRQVPSWLKQLEGDTLVLPCVRVSDEEASTIAKNLREKKNLETLELWKVKVSDSGLCAIVGALRDNNSLKKFILTRIQIPDQVAHALGGALRVNTILQELILWEVEVSDEGMSVIAGALHVNRNLMKLKLFSTGVTDEGCSAIASALTVNRSLRSLNVAYTKISDSGAHALGEALRVNQGLQELQLYNTGVTDEGCSAIASALTVNRSLRSLNLQWTNVSDDGVRALGEALHVNQSLQTLDLGHTKVSDNGVRALGEALRVNQSLQTLDLGHTKVSDDGVHALGGALRVNQSLQTLDLGLTNMSDDGVRVLGEALHVNQSLQTLDLRWTNVSDDGIRALGEALHVNQSLQTLNLWNTNVSDDGVRALTEALHVNQSLQTLEIDFGKVSDGAASEFVAAIEVNSSLKKLKVWNTSDTSKEVMKRLKEITTRKSIELSMLTW